MVAGLWCDKYAPKTSKEIRANRLPINKVRQWLQTWSLDGNRAILLSGPPGTGKTTTSKLLCEEQGYTPIEFNASENRSKLDIEHLISGVTLNKPLSGIFNINKQNNKNTSFCLIMDEVDGLSGGDRGGSTALCQLIKNTKVPIICICNDRQSNKVRPIAGLSTCINVKFDFCSEEEMLIQAEKVIKIEGLKISRDMIQKIIRKVQGDFRQLYMDLESSNLDNSDTNRNVNKKKEIVNNSVDREKGKDGGSDLNAFTATQKLLTHGVVCTLSERRDLFYVDYDMIPLLVQQNYLKAGGTNSNTRDIARASGYLSIGELIGSQLRTQQDWSLLPSHGLFSCIIPSLICSNWIPFVEFSQWFGRNSTRKKHQRLAEEICGKHMGRPITSLRNSRISFSLFPRILRHTLFGIIEQINKNKNKSASYFPNGNFDLNDLNDPIELAVTFISIFGLPKDVMKEHLSCLILKNENNLLDTISTKVKSQLTRNLNKQMKDYDFQVTVENEMKGVKGAKNKKASKAKDVKETEKRGNGGITKRRKLASGVSSTNPVIDSKSDEESHVSTQEDTSDNEGLYHTV